MLLEQPAGEECNTGGLVLGLILIFAVGVTLGLLGAGGAAIALPVLVYINGMEPHHAVTVTLLIVGTVSALGAVLHHRKGKVRWRTALAFAPAGVVGAWLGSKASYLLSGRALLLSFSALLGITAIRMLRDPNGGSDAHPPQSSIAMAAVGFGIGLITGLLGVGGGFVIVPALLYFGGVSMREAIGTSLVIIALNTAVAFASHMERQAIEVASTAGLVASAGAGMAAGTWLSHRTHPARLKKWFALVLLGLAAYMAARNLRG
jgi:uncharacterized protein